MNKPYVVISLADGEIGIIKERSDFNEAVEIGTQLAAEQCDTPRGQIRQELEIDCNFTSADGDIEIVIAQVDDD